MTVLHIIAGLLALLSGAVALVALKGGKLHRKSGTVFVYTMLFMSGTGAVLATMVPDRLSVIAGLLTFYLVVTALLAVQPLGATSRKAHVGALLVALATGVIGFYFGYEAQVSGTGVKDGQPTPVYFVFGSVALLAAMLDIRMLRAGGLQGVQRLTRHLWRMCFALLIACASFFLGQAQVFPEPMRILPLLAAPVLLVLLILIYWLVRVRWPLKRSAALNSSAM
ncbi:MAG TPA: hypothetical protein VIG90_19305 [Pedomonas sp.]|uniref:hypothetical protein n=1 Tax=Pedomonas sp. TaxID=2976421 RepID=UPI002F41ADB9